MITTNYLVLEKDQKTDSIVEAKLREGLGDLAGGHKIMASRKVDPTISLPGDGSVPPKAPKPAVKEEKAGAAKKGAPAKKTKKAPVVDPQDVWPDDV